MKEVIMSKIKVFSMFDGVGGFIVGLHEANKKLNKKFFLTNYIITNGRLKYEEEIYGK